MPVLDETILSDRPERARSDAQLKDALPCVKYDVPGCCSNEPFGARFPGVAGGGGGGGGGGGDGDGGGGGGGGEVAPCTEIRA
jgi:hypothetical protein